MKDRKLSDTKRDALQDLADAAGESREAQDRKYAVADFLAGAEIRSTRRNILTAFGVLWLFVGSWQAYVVGVDYSDRIIGDTDARVVFGMGAVAVGIVGALGSAVCYSLSIRNSVFAIANRFVFVAFLLSALCLAIEGWLGLLLVPWPWSVLTAVVTAANVLHLARRQARLTS